MRRGLTVITPPTFEPVELGLAKKQCDVEADRNDRDDELNLWISAARGAIEQFTGRTLCEKTLEAVFEGYPDWYIEIPKPPVIEVVSFKYTDSNGVDTTLATDQYVLDNAIASAPRVVPAYGETWPATRWQASSLRIRYRAGYAQAGSPDERGLIPAELRSAVLLMVRHFYENPSAVTEKAMNELPLGVQWLCKPYRVEGII